MSKTSVVTARLDPEILAGLERLAEFQDRSRSWLVAEAVRRFVKEETEFFSFLQEGEAAIAQGDYITHKQLTEEILERRVKNAA